MPSSSRLHGTENISHPAREIYESTGSSYEKIMAPIENIVFLPATRGVSACSIITLTLTDIRM